MGLGWERMGGIGGTLVYVLSSNRIHDGDGFMGYGYHWEERLGRTCKRAMPFFSVAVASKYEHRSLILCIFFLLLDTHSNISLYILSIAYHSIVNTAASRTKKHVPIYLVLPTYTPSPSYMLTGSICAGTNTFTAYHLLKTCPLTQ